MPAIVCQDLRQRAQEQSRCEGRRFHQQFLVFNLTTFRRVLPPTSQLQQQQFVQAGGTLMRRTSGGTLPGRSQKTGDSSGGSSCMSAGCTPGSARSSMSCAKIWNTYGWNSCTSSCAPPQPERLKQPAQ